jgi:hypothetical protein
MEAIMPKKTKGLPAVTSAKESKPDVADVNSRPKAFPRVRIENQNGTPMAVVEAETPDQFLQAFGVATHEVADGLAGQLTNAGASKRPTAEEANFAIHAVKEFAPRDTVEALLASQMVAVHMATMAAARRLAGVDNIAQHDTNLNAFNKLARTFASQVEALKRYRSKGEQRVYVERVNVEPGAQAIVGTVSQGGRGD